MISREEIKEIFLEIQEKRFPNMTDAQKARLQAFLDDERNYNLFKEDE